jgi:hypothetical protein
LNGGLALSIGAKLLEIGAYDLILGMDWLERFRPMMCDWLEEWIEFQYNGNLSGCKELNLHL